MDSETHYYRRDIDGLRAMAILLVIFYHAFPSVLPYGFVGVDIFYVISGYLITGTILREKDFSFLTFYARRFRRLLPALFTVLLATGILGTAILSKVDLASFGSHLVAGATFTTNFLLVMEGGYFDKAAHLKPLLHLWSLGVEEQFYLVWPAILIFIRNKKAFYSALGLLAISFAISVFQSFSMPNVGFYLLPSRFWELLAGCLLAMSEQKPSRYLFAALGLTGLIASQFFNNSLSFPGAWALLPVLGTCFLIKAGPDGRFNRILSGRGPVLLGLISYPLYLWHWPLLCFRQILENRGVISIHPAYILLLSTGFAYLTWERVEKPLRRKLNFASTEAWRPQTAVVASLVGISLFVIVGAAVTKGLLQAPDSLRSVGMLYGIDPPERKINNCWVELESGNRHDPNCTEAKVPSGVNRILLLGDSFAGHFSEGLKNLEGELNYKVLELIATSCPPIFDLDDSFPRPCRDFNNSLKTELQRINPDYVVMFAWWSSYWKRAGFKERAAETLAQLQQLKLRNVVVMGPAPEYTSVPDIVSSQFLSKGFQVPDRISNTMSPRATEAEQVLRSLSQKHKFHYISLYSPPLCTDDGCQIKFGELLGRDLYSYDCCHLSESSGTYVARQYIAPLLNRN